MQKAVRRIGAVFIATASVAIVCARRICTDDGLGRPGASPEHESGRFGERRKPDRPDDDVMGWTTSWDGGPHGLPDCIPVDSRSASDVGCELKTDFVAASPDPNLPGVPVYDDKGAAPGKVVGHMVPGIDGFVPLSLTTDPDTLKKLVVCNQELVSQQALDEGCEPLLREMGTPRSYFPPSSEQTASTTTP